MSEKAEKLAGERIERALQKVERAQNLLGEAAAELSPIIGMVNLWKKACRLGDETQSYWHRLSREGRGKRYSVDATCLAHHEKGEAGR